MRFPPLLAGLPALLALALPVLALLLLAPPAAADARSLSEAERLVRAGEHRAAQRVLSAFAPATPEERLRRDWALAISHIRSHEPRAALPYLERLVSAAPGAVRYRLELAYALYLMGEDDRARLHFTQSLGADLSDTERRAVGAHLDRIAARKNWEGRFSFALIPESNAARRTGAETVDIGGLTFLLNPDARSAPGTGLSLAGGFTWLPRLSAGTRGRLHVAGAARLFEDRRLHEIVLRGEAGLVWPRDRGRQAGLGLSAQAAWAGGRGGGPSRRGPGYMRPGRRGSGGRGICRCGPTPTGCATRPSPPATAPGSRRAPASPGPPARA